MNKIELRHAYVWTCEECGRDNFGTPIVAEFEAEEIEELREEHGIQPWEEGDWLAMPEKVACKFCGSEFETRPYDSEADE